MARAPAVDVKNVAATIRHKKISQIVADELRRRIAREEIIGGDLLPNERILQEEFGVSRPTLREAMRILEAEGLLTTPRGGSKGARVNTPNADQAANYAGLVLQVRGATLRDVFALRTLVEPAAARMVAERKPRPDLSELRALVERRAAARANPREIANLNRAFDQTLLMMSGNEAFGLVGQIMSHITNLHIDSIPDQVDELPEENALGIDRSQDRLARLVDLIEAGDGPAVEKLARERLEDIEGLHRRRTTPSDRLMLVK